MRVSYRPYRAVHSCLNAFPGFHPGLFSLLPTGGIAVRPSPAFGTCKGSPYLPDPSRRSASIRLVRISLMRVRCPSPLERSLSSTCGSRRTLTATLLRAPRSRARCASRSSLSHKNFAENYDQMANTISKEKPPWPCAVSRMSPVQTVRDVPGPYPLTPTPSPCGNLFLAPSIAYNSHGIINL